jgi:hypothetical protein
MDLTTISGNLLSIFGPAGIVLVIGFLTLNTLMARTKRQEENQRKTILIIVKVVSMLVKHNNLPPESITEVLKDTTDFLVNVPTDDILQKVLGKVTGV